MLAPDDMTVGGVCWGTLIRKHYHFSLSIEYLKEYDLTLDLVFGFDSLKLTVFVSVGARNVYGTKCRRNEKTELTPYTHVTTWS